MRMPNSTQMSQEQKDIYLNAPLTGNIIITGPPGTGKTVIAFLRANTIAAKKNDKAKVQVIMFSKVLSRYTNNLSNSKYTVTTMHKWFFDWWKNLNHKETENQNVEDDFELEVSGIKVYLPGCAYFTKEKMEETFGAWKGSDGKATPEARRNNIWWTFQGKPVNKWFTVRECYDANPIYKKYARPVNKDIPEAPTVEDNVYAFDWNQVQLKLSEDYNRIKEDKSYDWGHLIIDEAQDFSCQMYKVLRFVQNLFHEKTRPSLTIFADENQRIREDNSTIEEIINNLDINQDSNYILKENFRNTRQIAKVAAHFYSGLKTGIPKIPQRSGEVPKLIRTKKYSQTIDYIFRYIKNNTNEEIGIFVEGHIIKEKYIKSLKSKCEGIGVKVQSYKGEDKSNPYNKDHEKVYNNFRNLEFDKGNCVSIFTLHSVKGLEFDTVFIPELEGYGMPLHKETMYVLTSRARTKLFLMYTNEDDSSHPKVLEYFPIRENLLNLEVYSG